MAQMVYDERTQDWKESFNNVALSNDTIFKTYFLTFFCSFMETQNLELMKLNQNLEEMNKRLENIEDELIGIKYRTR